VMSCVPTFPEVTASKKLGAVHPFTSRAKKVLELSLREAKRLGRDHIGTGHILLGLISEGEGVAAQVLVKAGADLDQARMRIQVD
jgi:ATP-dependent Clp protease ATP-binding subunit ClpC